MGAKPQKKIQMGNTHLLSIRDRLSLSSHSYLSESVFLVLSQLTSEKSQGNWLLFKAQWYFPVGNLWHSPAVDFDEVAAAVQPGDSSWNEERNMTLLENEQYLELTFSY